MRKISGDFFEKKNSAKFSLPRFNPMTLLSVFSLGSYYLSGFLLPHKFIVLNTIVCHNTNL
jgi:hypothetical protein